MADEDSAMEDLGRELRKLADTVGADFFGIADLRVAKEAIVVQGGSALAEYPKAASIGLVLPQDIVDQLPNRRSASVQTGYRHHAYDVINQRLDHIASRISAFLQKRGFRSLPIPASVRVDEDRLMGVFSNKMAAHLAGLGWIGKSCLLVTPQVGPRVRWASVLTDAPLEPTGEPLSERCGSCSECVEICPPRAFTGRAYRDDEHRDLRFDVRKCDDYFEQLKQEMVVPVCGMCLYVCPHGRRRTNTARSAEQPVG
jgi:epoxyqueuosine reductase QueG